MSEHGTRTKYVHDKCRCAKCRTANADYQRDYMYEWQQRKRKQARAERAATSDRSAS